MIQASGKFRGECDSRGTENTESVGTEPINGGCRLPDSQKNR